MNVTCPLCGGAVDLKANCHAGCPMSKGCSLVRCAHCRYEFPDPTRSTAVRLLERLFGRKLGEEALK